MPLYAEIDPRTNAVKRVIVAHSAEWCETRLGGTWVITRARIAGEKYAAVGDTYRPDLPSRFESTRQR